MDCILPGSSIHGIFLEGVLEWVAISCKDGLNKGWKWYGLKQKILRRGGKKTQKNYTKKIFMTQITMMV